MIVKAMITDPWLVSPLHLLHPSIGTGEGGLAFFEVSIAPRAAPMGTPHMSPLLKARCREVPTLTSMVVMGERGTVIRR